MRFLILIMALSLEAAEVIDKVVAIVNKEPVLLSQNKPGHDLETLIDEVLIAQEIKKLGLEVSESELELTIQNVMKQHSLTPPAFEAALKTQGLTLPEYRESLKQQMYKMRLIQSKVKNRVSAKAGSEMRLRAEQAVFATKEEAQKALEKQNADFKDLGMISKSDLRDSLAQVVFSLKEGETSKPLESPQGFVLIKVKKRFEIPLEKVDKQRYEQELETAFKRYVKELRASAYIERK
ncbi:MAG: peptidyl-prolyl cis-trans isomerase [Myxococcaceae bacterium]